MTRQVRVSVHWNNSEVSGLTNSLTNGNVAATDGVEMWIGPDFYKEVDAIRIITGKPFEDIVACILNHEELHYVFEKFIKSEGYKWMVRPDATHGLDILCKNMVFAKVYEKFGIEVPVKHDIEMGI